MMREPRTPHGFTLVELMIVVAIIGILASIAMPGFTKLQLRARAAERALTLGTIKKAFDARFLAIGQISPVGEPDDAGLFQPPLPAATSKRMPDWKADGWKDLSIALEGATYYSYAFTVVDGGAGSQTLTLMAYGDLDGDGKASRKAVVYNTSQVGVQWSSETPAAGEEDDAGPDKTF